MLTSKYVAYSMFTSVGGLVAWITRKEERKTMLLSSEGIQQHVGFVRTTQRAPILSRLPASSIMNIARPSRCPAVLGLSESTRAFVRAWSEM